MKTTQILGVNICAESFNENAATLRAFFGDVGGDTRMVFTPNPEVISRAFEDEQYKKILNAGDLVVADGIGVLIASYLGKIKINGRTTGIDLISATLNGAKDGALTVYLLGGKPTVAERAGQKIEQKYVGVTVVGSHDGYFDEQEERIILENLQILKPDLLLVGLGFPKQETWIYNHRKLNIAKVAIGCGGSLDVFAGEVKRAPAIFRKIGLEWFYRLITQPSRFFRMLKLPVFLIRVIVQKIKR